MILRGDCISIMRDMPDRSIDMIFTDPPYGLNYNDGDLAHAWEQVFGGDITNMAPRPIANDGPDALLVFEQMLEQAARLLKRPGCCCCCCGGGGGPQPLFARWTLLMDKHLKFKQAVVWDKGGLGMGIHYRRNYEFVLVAHTPGKCTWNGGNSTANVLRLSRIIPRSDQHPTQKPVELARHFIRLHSNPGDTILDPFCGSGTTGEAALSLDRKFIGIEIDSHWADVTERRLEEVQKVMF